MSTSQNQNRNNSSGIPLSRSKYFKNGIGSILPKIDKEKLRSRLYYSASKNERALKNEPEDLSLFKFSRHTKYQAQCMEVLFPEPLVSI